MKLLETDRIYLKLIEEKDLEYLLNLRCDVNVCSGIIHTPLNMEKQKIWYKNLGEKHSYIIIESKSNTYLGTIGFNQLNRLHQKATWYVRLDSKYQGKGYGNEASKIFVNYEFNHMNINRLDCDCFDENPAAAANIKKLGFKQEGILKEFYFHEGKFKNIILFSLLKNDFLKFDK